MKIFVTATISEPQMNHIKNRKKKKCFSVEGKGSDMWKSIRPVALWARSTHPEATLRGAWETLLVRAPAVLGAGRASLIHPKAEQSLSYAPVIYIDFLKFKQILNGWQLLITSLIQVAGKRFCVIQQAVSFFFALMRNFSFPSSFWKIN